MRLVMFERAGGQRVGAVCAAEMPAGDGTGGEKIVDLGAESIVDLLADEQSLAVARETIAAASQRDMFSQSDCRLLPPVRPSKILCLGYNYRGHVPPGADPTAADPAYPEVFVKTPNVLTGPDDPVALPAESSDVDYEGEIAIVIGRQARNVSQADALDYVAGYTLFNDVSARDWQLRTSQWELGKCFDGFGPLGPQLVTPDEAGDPQHWQLEVRRGGVTTVSQNTSTMIFSMAFIVHYLSTAMTLVPGDVISTGSPQKLPAALASHRPLAPGDAVTISVPEIGELTTVFTAPIFTAPREGSK